MAVTPSDIAVALGRTAPADPSVEWSQWEMWIADALMLIAAHDFGEDVEDLDDLDQDRLDYVVREAVVAQVRRPDDATQVDIRVDDGSVGKTYRTSSGRVTILDIWWDLLTPAGGNSGHGAFSIFPAGGTCSHMPWCSLAFGALYCSCGADLTNYQYPLYEGGVLTGTDGYAGDEY
jgi:hypothetical protein